MESMITVVHVLAAAGLIGLVLLQHGKGADMGAAFGSGASGSLFGVGGSSNFLSRATSVCVITFFATSLSLAYYASDNAIGNSVVEVPANAAASTEVPTVSDTPEAIPTGNTTKDIPN